MTTLEELKRITQESKDPLTRKLAAELAQLKEDVTEPKGFETFCSHECMLKDRVWRMAEAEVNKLRKERDNE